MLEGRDLLEQLRLGIGAELIEPGSRDLEMEGFAIGCLAFHQQGRDLQAGDHRRRQIGGDRRARNADGQIRAQMRDQVLAHPLIGAAGQRLLKRRARDARRFDGAERDDDRALAAIARRRQHHRQRIAVLPDAHAGDPHPVVRLGFGDQVLHMAVRDDHDALARIGLRPDAVGLRAREPRRPDQRLAQR